MPPRLRGPRSMPAGVTSGVIAAGNVRAHQTHEAAGRRQAARTAVYVKSTDPEAVTVGIADFVPDDLRARSALMAAARQTGAAAARAAAELKARFRCVLMPGDGVAQPWPPPGPRQEEVRAWQS